MSKKSLKFRLNGESLDFTHQTPCVKKVIEYLDSLADGELLETKELIRVAGVGEGFRNCSTNPALTPYFATLRYPYRRKVYGNKRTIQELRSHKEAIA